MPPIDWLRSMFSRHAIGFAPTRFDSRVPRAPGQRSRVPRVRSSGTVSGSSSARQGRGSRYYTQMPSTDRSARADADMTEPSHASSRPGIRETVQRLGVVAENLASSSAQLDRFMTDNAGPVSEFTRNGLPEIERLVEESRAAADELRALSRSLRDDPSQLIYPPSPRGVEVPR